jgi:hypothetical protein
MAMKSLSPVDHPNEDTSHVTAGIRLPTVTAGTITVGPRRPNVKSLSGAISASQTAAAGDARDQQDHGHQ